MSDNADPRSRLYFVYRAFDADGALLYVGCTKRPELRHQEHRQYSGWFSLATRYTMQGPYTYEVGRRIERDAVRSEHPIWNWHEPRRSGMRAIYNRMVDRWINYYRTIEGKDDPGPAIRRGVAHVDALIPSPRSRPRVAITEVDLARARKVEREDRAEFARRSA